MKARRLVQLEVEDAVALRAEWGGRWLTAPQFRMGDVLIFSETADAIAETVIARVPWGRARKILGELFTSIRRYATHHVALTNVLVGSILVQVLRVTQAYYLGVALGINQPLLTYFEFIPLILLIMFLPITANGIGTSQAAFLYLFSKVGTPSAEAFALSVLFVALGIVGNIPGAIFYLRRSSSAEAVSRAAERDRSTFSGARQK